MKKHFRYDVPCEESKIQKTIEISKAAFAAGEAEYSVSHIEFLYQQSKYIRKRWWVLQGILLIFLCCILHLSESDYSVRRSLGIAAPLFVILILPELWKNRSANAMEIECTTFFSLRQIYAARLSLFAGVDVILLTLFFVGTSFTAKVTLWEMMVEFLLPFNVACCICFRSLYSKRINTESLSLLLCSVWTGLWTLVILNDAVYHAVSVPVWVSALMASFLYMGYAIFRGQEKWQQTLEVKPLWN